jgi:hypothetical protein
MWHGAYRCVMQPFDLCTQTSLLVWHVDDRSSLRLEKAEGRNSLFLHWTCRFWTSANARLPSILTLSGFLLSTSLRNLRQTHDFQRVCRSRMNMPLCVQNVLFDRKPGLSCCHTVPDIFASFTKWTSPFGNKFDLKEHGKRRVFKDDYQFRTIRLSKKYLLP